MLDDPQNLLRLSMMRAKEAVEEVRLGAYQPQKPGEFCYPQAALLVKTVVDLRVASEFVAIAPSHVEAISKKGNQSKHYWALMTSHKQQSSVEKAG